METFTGQIAPAEAESSLRCSSCGRYLSNEELDQYILQTILPRCCAKMCAEPIFYMCADAEKFMDPMTVRTAEWFHATDRVNWMDDLMDNPIDEVPLVHIGTRETAVTLMMDKYKGATAPTYLYKVTMADDTALHSEIFSDENEWPEVVSDVRPEGNAYRYVNVWESTGSVSLLADPRILKVESVEVITPEKFNDFVVDVLGADSRYLTPYVYVKVPFYN